MRYLSIFILLGLLSSCASSKIKSIEGKWKQEFLSYKTENKILPKTDSETLIDIIKDKNKLKIEFDFNDGYDKDQTDSVFFNYPQLKFRKINLDKTSNYYNLTYQANCDCFLGEMNSFSGNILNIKLNRVKVSK